MKMADRLNQWLHYVDSLLSPEAVEFLKLGLHSEFHRYYSEVEKLNKPSLLYHLLLKQRRDQSKYQVLQMFLHVLKGLGGKLRGNLVIRKGFGEVSIYRLNDPGPFDTGNASSEFRFFQCLLKILTKVRKDRVLRDRVKT